jgi:hypothetical protein
MALSTSNEQVAAAFQSAIQAQEGRQYIAQRLREPVQKELDYIGIGRQGFIQDVLAQGEIPYYDLDITTNVTVLPSRGSIPQVQVGVKRVEPTILTIACYPVVSFMDAKIRTYNILDRVQEKAASDFAKEEDILIFGTPGAATNWDSGSNPQDRLGVSIYAAATGSTTGPKQWYTQVSAQNKDAFNQGFSTVSTSTTGLSKEVLKSASVQILKYRLIPQAILCNPVEYADMWLWNRDDVDMETQKEVLQTGRMGKVWNMDILMSDICPEGTFYVRTSDRQFGVMPILAEMESGEEIDYRNQLYCFPMWAYEGFAILNNRGITKGTVTRTDL